MTAEPTATLAGPAATGSLGRPAEAVARWALCTLVALLLAAAVLVGWRRLAGALVNPLPPALLCSVGLAAAAAAALARLAWRRMPPNNTASTEAVAHSALQVMPSVAVLTLGASVSLADTSPIGLAAFWALLAAEECWAWQRIIRQRLRRRGTPPVGPRQVRLDPPRAPVAHPPPAFGEEAPADDVLQQLTRSQAADGSEQISGWLRLPFAAGQRTGSVHVAFCPAFAGNPDLTVEQLDGPEARIRTAQLLPFGARLDLKLNAPAEQAGSVLLQFSARSAGVEGREARDSLRHA